MHLIDAAKFLFKKQITKKIVCALRMHPTKSRFSEKNPLFFSFVRFFNECCMQMCAIQPQAPLTYANTFHGMNSRFNGTTHSHFLFLSVLIFVRPCGVRTQIGRVAQFGGRFFIRECQWFVLDFVNEIFWECSFHRTNLHEPIAWHGMVWHVMAWHEIIQTRRTCGRKWENTNNLRRLLILKNE